MKPRRVTLTVEIETDISVRILRNKLLCLLQFYIPDRSLSDSDMQMKAKKVHVEQIQAQVAGN